MQTTFTPGADRALKLASALARKSGSYRIEPVHLLWALVLDESRGAEILFAHGLPTERLRELLPLPAADSVDGLSLIDDPGEPSDELRSVLLEARRQASSGGKQNEVGSEHLLCGLTSIPSPVEELLSAHGLNPAAAADRSLELAGEAAGPIATEIELSLPDDSAADAADTCRILDAAANRAREGLRVVEDYVRFTLDDQHLTSLLKNWRHRLAEVLATIDDHRLVSSRETARDVGTTIATRREGLRASLAHVVVANFKRVEEAARTLEEYGKVLSSEFARRLEGLRYELYTIEKAVVLTDAARKRLAGRELYVLVSSELCPHGPGPVIAAALAGGAGIIQVREKKMSDRELVTYGRFVRERTARAGALFIMNDRPDLALLTDADGVHVGQDELPVREARRIVGPSRLVGVSTHTIEQARQAVLDGADYIGVGPVFTSSTKSFNQLAGLELVRQVAAEIKLPAYAIGGINLETIGRALAAGAHRVAASGAICGAGDPAEITRRLNEVISRSSAARAQTGESVPPI